MNATPRPIPATQRSPGPALTTVLTLIAAAFAAGTEIARAEQEIYSNADGAKTLTFSVDLIGAAYSSTDSWFGESTGFLGASTDDWADFGAEPSIRLEMPMANGQFFGEISAVYTSTYGDDASGLTIGLEDKQEFTLEQGHIGWSRADLFGSIENDSLTITLGRQDYSIGTGLLINDGGADGGEFGGWYLGMRRAFSEALVVSFDTDRWLAEVFNLKNRPREGGTQGQAYGSNVEYAFDFGLTLGGSYILADSRLPGSDQLDVASARFDWQLDSGLGFSGEVVDQSSEQIEATGFYGQVSYAMDHGSWVPVFSYRYAAFDGDDPMTPSDERFREIAYGFTDYGSWYQGEITGEYILGNGNLTSHMLRAEAKPRERMTVNLMYYQFSLDQPSAFGVTSDEWGDEINFTVDWDASDSFHVVGVVGLLMPGLAAEEWTGGGSDWVHAMLYLSYSW